MGVLTTYGGARFRALSEAAALMRGDLCASLLHHCTSDVTELVSLSLRVFVALVAGFKVKQKFFFFFFFYFFFFFSCCFRSSPSPSSVFFFVSFVFLGRFGSGIVLRTVKKWLDQVRRLNIFVSPL